MRLPLFVSLRGYRSGWLRGDAVAGLTVWAVLVPEALAYATIAGVSPVVGLYAAPAALILYAAFGSSKHLNTGPMSATAALSAAAVAKLATQGSGAFVALTAALAITTGVAAVAAGLLRLGFLANFISEPVLKGFIVGLALTVIVGQLPLLFGVEKGSGNVFEELWDLFTNIGATNGWVLLAGFASLAVVLVLKRVAPMVPGPLVAVVLGILAVWAFGLEDRGVKIVGSIQGGLPPLDLPDIGFGNYLNLSASAIGIALVAFAEGLGAAKTYAAQHHYEVDANRELLGMGTANLGAGLSGGMVVGGSLSKTAVNGSAGAKTQVSGLIVAGLTVLTLFFLTGLFERLPVVTLAAVVIAAVIELVDIPSLVRLYKVWTNRLGAIYGLAARPDFIAALAALAGVLVFDILPGLFIGIAVSLLLLIYRASRPNVAVLGRTPDASRHWEDLSRHPENESVPGVVVLRVESGLFFANADHVRSALKEHAAQQGVHALVLDAETVPFVDVTAAEMIDGLRGELAREGVTLLLARDIGQVRDVLRVTLATDGGTRPVFPTVEAAVEAATRSGNAGATESTQGE